MFGAAGVQAPEPTSESLWEDFMFLSFLGPETVRQPNLFTHFAFLSQPVRQKAKHTSCTSCRLYQSVTRSTLIS